MTTIFFSCNIFLRTLANNRQKTKKIYNADFFKVAKMTFFSIIFFCIIEFFYSSYGDRPLKSTKQYGKFQHKSPYEIMRYSAFFFKMEVFNDVAITHGMS